MTWDLPGYTQFFQKLTLAFLNRLTKYTGQPRYVKLAYL